MGAESEERYRALAEAAHDMIFIIGRDDTVQYVNSFAAAQFGMKPEEITGRLRSELFPPGTSESQNRNLRRVMESGQPLYAEGEALFGETRMWLGTWLAPIHDVSGEVKSVLGISRDITARKKAEEELRRLNDELERRVEERTAALAESEAKYRRLVENTLDIPCNIDANGIIRYVGRQVKRYGFEPADLEERNFLERVHPDDRERVAADFQKTLATGETFPSEFRVRSPDGRMYWFEERSTLQRDPSGAPIGFTGVLRDVTERKQAEVLRNNQQKRLQQLTAKLASAQDEEQRRIGEGLHDDVAQILVGCGMNLGLARDAENLDDMRSGLDRIGELLREAVKKVRGLSFELSSSTLFELGLREAIEELCESMSARYNIRLEVRGDGTINGLDEATARVLFKSARELLFNVVKHSGVQQAIVSISGNGENVQLAVEDRGEGFSSLPDEREPEAGKGLGLFWISERVRDLGGTMKLESIAGERTRVTVRLPRPA